MTEADIQAIFDPLPPEVPKKILIPYVKAKFKGDTPVTIELVKERVPKKLYTLEKRNAKDYLSYLLNYPKLLGFRGKLPIDVAIAVALFEGFVDVDRPRSIRYIKTRINSLLSTTYRTDAYKRLTHYVTSPIPGFIIPTIPVHYGIRPIILYMELKDLGLITEADVEEEKTEKEIINIPEFLDTIVEKYNYLFEDGRIPMSVLQAIVDYELSEVKDFGLNIMVDVETLKEKVKTLATGRRNLYISLQNYLRRFGDTNIVTKVIEHLPAVVNGRPVVGVDVIVDWAVAEFGVHWAERLISFAYDEILTYYPNGMVKIADYNEIKGKYRPSPVKLAGILLTAKMKIKSYVEQNGLEGVNEFIEEAKNRGEEWARYVRHVSKSGVVTVRMGSKTVKFSILA